MDLNSYYRVVETLPFNEVGYVNTTFLYLEHCLCYVNLGNDIKSYMYKQ